MTERYLGHSMVVVGPGIRTGMPLRYDNPREIGADRLVNAVAAYARLGGPCVVVDFGTAITYDPVSAEGEYLGGIISPGRGDLARGAHRARRPAAQDRRRPAPLADRQDHDRRDPLGHRLRLRGPGGRDPRRGCAMSWAATAPRSPRAAWPRRSSRSAPRSTRWTTCSRSPACACCTSATPNVRTMSHTALALREPFRIGDLVIPNRVVLAPLAGIGNWFVRLQARRHGAGLVVSEMVSSFAVHYRNERTVTELLRIHPDERTAGDGGPISMQLFGQDPDIMRSAAAPGGRGRRRPDRPQHGLPRAQGVQDRRRSRPALRPRPRRRGGPGRARGKRPAGDGQAALGPATRGHRGVGSGAPAGGRGRRGRDRLSSPLGRRPAPGPARPRAGRRAGGRAARARDPHRRPLGRAIGPRRLRADRGGRGDARARLAGQPVAVRPGARPSRLQPVRAGGHLTSSSG